MTLLEAALALDVPANKANCNCVQDAQWRLRDNLKLALRGRTLDDVAPGYVVRSVNNLNSWLR